MSIVNSNSSLMISISVVFEINPSLVADPPNATKASTMIKFTVKNGKKESS